MIFRLLSGILTLGNTTFFEKEVLNPVEHLAHPS